MNIGTAMRYYFAQHGKALSSDIDVTRSLSPEGIDETQTIAETLKRNSAFISRLVHSGKERAAQTAQIFASALDIKSSIKIDGMAPNDDVVSFCNTISSSEFDNTLFIGHLPHLQKVISFLLIETTSSDIIAFQNSAVACIETNADNAHILWYITPDII